MLAPLSVIDFLHEMAADLPEDHPDRIAVIRERVVANGSSNLFYEQALAFIDEELAG